MKTRNGILTAYCLVSVLGVPAATEADTSFEATVYGEHHDGKILYHYAITNKSNKPLSRFTIGVGRSDAQYRSLST